MRIYDDERTATPTGRVLVCSGLVVENVWGPPRRGFVQSAFPAAANLLFSDGSWLSLNTLPASFPAEAGDARKGRRYIHGNSKYSVDFLFGEHFLHIMPNGLLLDTRAGGWPVGKLRPGMPVILGAGRLVIEAISCSIDCGGGRRWSPRIVAPERLNGERIRDNAAWLARFCRSRRPPDAETLPVYAEQESILALAERLCGRGRGLTPAGDDFLAGWMAAGWLVNGPQPAFLADCRRVLEIAERRTHALSRCWLAYAADGAVAHPIGTLLTALTTLDHVRLARAAAHTLALGATSGYDLLRGILFGLAQFIPEKLNDTSASSFP